MKRHARLGVEEIPQNTCSSRKQSTKCIRFEGRAENMTFDEESECILSYYRLFAL